MDNMEIARKFLALDEKDEAVKAYKLALGECRGREPRAEFECALNILQFGHGEDYKISFSIMVDLFNRKFAQAEIRDIMKLAFYHPNIRKQQKRYEKNCRSLARYPYIFRKDFPDFEDLPLNFYPYADNQYMIFDVEKGFFSEFYEPYKQVISRNFFKDLEKPILAADVFSQYELEYLVDNVRKSEWVARENHIYLHYTDWRLFCAYLQVLDLQPLLKERKIVFLFDKEIAQYPIDFKERYNIDYSQYEVKPIGIREVNRLIWHTQLSSHNGGDFFNEIFDSHPNLLAMPSVIFDTVTKAISKYKQALSKSQSLQEALWHIEWPQRIVKELYNMRNRTDKDILVAIFLCENEENPSSFDAKSRIAPAIFFQPHFYNMFYQLHAGDNGVAKLYSKPYEKIHKSALFYGFKYIKTFTPMRRITTSYGATVKFKCRNFQGENISVMDDVPLNHVLNRSFMIDWQDRLFKDCRLVRFEDGKLNPRATFTALAAFLDLPYTESMTYCSEFGKIDPESYPGNDIGFSTAAIYRTYDDYATDAERAFIEYFMRDVYEYYGYDFHYYDGQPVDNAKISDWIDNFSNINKLIRESWIAVFDRSNARVTDDCGNETTVPLIIKQKMINKYMQNVDNMRWQTAKILMNGLNFVNKNGQPLHMMPKLELDPELLEQPLYH